MTQGGSGFGKVAGCGCSVTLAILMVIGLVGASLSSLSLRSQPAIPPRVPPAEGAPLPPVNVQAGGRTSESFRDWAASLSQQTRIPEAALRAYANAAALAQLRWPQCNLAWTTLAGIGYVETRHGTYSGKMLQRPSIGEDGNVEPPIVGIPLNGENNTVVIKDTEGGRLDGDTEFDRAIGPMQFIPTSWERYGIDANGDGIIDPQNIDDAAAAAAQLLCRGRDLSQPADWVSAVKSYNFSQEYIDKVRDAANAYGNNQSA